ncbi:hypothetical protein PoB_007626000 [Plakobranchus ocellatus]|uniref:Uncharacterized protein n=1 Tax=Plakobranchus ocellatus TaxID=259542 RepID=A0AAV4E091_9GAST|nr:hypothetical protein PoB_007626000 [Plakobranchus ocellatus]
MLWAEMEKNYEILKFTDQKPSLLETVRQKQLKIVWASFRRTGIENLLIYRKTREKMNWGQQIQCYIDRLRRFITCKGETLTILEVFFFNMDQDQWKSVVLDVYARTYT